MPAGADSRIPGIAYLRATAADILADGRVEPAEQDALYAAVEKVMPPELRKGAAARRRAAKAAERAVRVASKPLFKANFMVAGVLHEGRAEIVASSAAAGQDVLLVRELDSPFDPNAILVRLATGEDIGHVPRAYAAAMAKLLDIGCPHRARITKILNGKLAPIPVVDAKVFDKGSEVEGARSGLTARYSESQPPRTDYQSIRPTQPNVLQETAQSRAELIYGIVTRLDDEPEDPSAYRSNTLFERILGLILSVLIYGTANFLFLMFLLLALSVAGLMLVLVLALASAVFS